MVMEIGDWKCPIFSSPFSITIFLFPNNYFLDGDPSVTEFILSRAEWAPSG
jgi:hypothetical protein